MKATRFLWHGYKYFPYERMLARREVETFLGIPVRETHDGFLAQFSAPTTKNFGRLTYFRGVKVDSKAIVPDQARLEASANGGGLRWLPQFDPLPSLRRQSTRYSAHGLHEYRGKFNPQVVRAIGNLLCVEEGQCVLDPFCGSGTTLLEAAHIGWNCIGLDVNPLAVLIANAKITAFKTNPRFLQRESQGLALKLEDRLVKNRVEEPWQDHLPNKEYLARWFAAGVLGQLAAVLCEIDLVRTRNLREVFRVILSDICREVSLQDPRDLRIRRRKDARDTYPVVQRFLESLRTKVGAILRARQQLKPMQTSQLALLGDSRLLLNPVRDILAGLGHDTVDAAITSPPYATALPYIDTQRLSLCLLGLIRADAIRETERRLIGHREITEAGRMRLEFTARENAADLPRDVAQFCRTLLGLATAKEHGFRKRNVPALVYKYFSDMAQMFANIATLVRRGGHYALLVGRNRTNLRGKEIVIETPRLLASVADARGWEVEEILDLDTYQRFDVHRENSIRHESLVILRRR